MFIGYSWLAPRMWSAPYTRGLPPAPAARWTTSAYSPPPPPTTQARTGQVSTSGTEQTRSLLPPPTDVWSTEPSAINPEARQFTWERYILPSGETLIKEVSDDGVIRWFRESGGNWELLEAHAPYENTEMSALLRGLLMMGGPLSYLQMPESEPSHQRWWYQAIGEAGKRPSEMTPTELNRFWTDYFRTYNLMYNPNPMARIAANMGSAFRQLGLGGLGYMGPTGLGYTPYTPAASPQPAPDWLLQRAVQLLQRTRPW